MQGGGVAVYGSADFINCALYGNEADDVRARVLNLWSPSIALEPVHVPLCGSAWSTIPLEESARPMATECLLAFEPSGSFFHRPVEL